MDDHTPGIPLVTEPLPVAFADDEVVLTIQHDATSLTPEAGQETARRLVQAAEQLKSRQAGEGGDGA